jgi:transcription elongation factor GreA
MIALGDLEARQYPITAEGLSELRQRLEALRSARSAAVDEMRDLTSQSGNGALEDSARTLHRSQVAEMDAQMALIERIIGMAKVISKPDSTDHVQIGSQVTVHIDGKERTYTIVGSIEADPGSGKVSNESPIGKLLLGKKVDDYVEVVLPPRRIAARVVAIA